MMILGDKKGWTKVSEELPPEDFLVLVICDIYQDQCHVATRRERFRQDDWFTEFGDRVSPTHWRYLPEPPEYKIAKD